MNYDANHTTPQIITPLNIGAPVSITPFLSDVFSG